MADVNRCVLPALRLARLRADIDAIVGDRAKTQAVMEAIEARLENDTRRWGNACPEDGCGRLLAFEHGRFVCPDHGGAGSAGAVLLVGFPPLLTEAAGR